MPPSKILGLFGLSPITREEDLRNELGRYGKVEKVVLITDRRVRLWKPIPIITITITITGW
jgi:RNA recognition motif-containing protein